MGACCELVDWEMRQIGGDPFNMTVAGLRLVAARQRGVRAARRDRARDVAHVDGRGAIIAITNGVHAPTWQDARIRDAAAARGRAVGAHQALQARAARRGRGAHRRAARSRRADDRLRAPRRRYKRSDLILRDPDRIAPLLERRRSSSCSPARRTPTTRRADASSATWCDGARAIPQAVVLRARLRHGARPRSSRAAPTCGSTTRSARSRRAARRA